MRQRRVAGQSFGVEGGPIGWWCREVSDFDIWLFEQLDDLGRCLGMSRLEFVGRQVEIAQQYDNENGEDVRVGWMRIDIAARDERDRSVVIEVQLGDSDKAPRAADDVRPRGEG